MKIYKKGNYILFDYDVIFKMKHASTTYLMYNIGGVGYV